MIDTTDTFQAHCPDIQCEGCANAIRRTLGRLAGVQEVDVDTAGKQVTVRFDTAQVNAAEIRARLAQAGYPVG